MNSMHYKDLLKFANPNSSVAILTLWTICDQVVASIDKNLYFIAGQMYSKQGINYLVRNLLANKNIRYLIVCGQDRSGSGAQLLELWKKAKSDSVKKLIKNVELIDFIGEQDSKKIKVIIKKLDQAKKPWGKKELFPETKKKIKKDVAKQLPTDTSVFKVVGETVAETWLKVLKTTLTFGYLKSTDAMKMKELCNLTAVITNENPNHFSVPKWMNINLKAIEKYVPQIISGRKNKGLYYTYGNRFKSHFGIDQIERIVKRLKEDKNAREAIAILFDPRIDFEAKHRPCISLVQVLYNNEKIHLTAFVRSHDLFGGWPLNVFGLLKIQQEICQKTKLRPGPLTVISGSAHIYDFDWEKAEKLIKKNYLQVFETDLRGYFKIEIDKKNKEIVAKHFDNNGFYLQVFRQKASKSKAALQLAKEIENSLGVSLISHAFDLGIELQKAEIALKLGINYLQDKPLSL